MKRKIENFLKSNKVFNKLYSFFGSLLVRTIGLFVRVEPNTMLFVSFMGKSFNDSPKVIFDSILNDDAFDEYKLVWAFNDVDKYDVGRNTSVVKMDSFKYLVTALKAEYWITNVNIERGLHFKKKATTYVNTWHGIPLKKIGNDVKGRSDFNFSNVDLFCYSGTFEKDIYKRAFKLSDRNLFDIGMPRNEILYTEDKVYKKSVREKYNTKDKKIILYAPTWRDDESDLELMDIKQWEELLSDDYILFVKAHGLSDKFNVKDSKFVIDVSDYEETAELLIASDILITDYSSIMFDFAITSKPIFIYANDYEKYVSDRGVYFDLFDSALSVFSDASLLAHHIQEFDHDLESEKSKEFGLKYIEYRDKDSTHVIIDYIKNRNETSL